MNANERLSRLIAAERAVAPPRHATLRGWKRLIAAVTLGTPSLAIAQVTIPTVASSLIAEGVAVALIVGTVGTGIIVATAPPVEKHAAPKASYNAAHRRRNTADYRARIPSETPSVSTSPAPIDTDSPRENTEARENRTVEPPRSPSSRTVPFTQTHAAPVIARVSPAESPETSDLEAELQLIAQAKRELDRGNTEIASSLLKQHASRFPSGAMVVEREGLHVLMSCGDETLPNRQALAESYMLRHPSSPLLDRIRRACSKDVAREISK